eukprot:TRINITY_DN470_c0_g1_i1.p1 TRINITY_DN470_c0_g1~~TRINITY_DN470_c0_g1_i1.p1  ORF type:complete len:159 (-),score=41.46 TRINITY_DN470_c0_g1_i1:93-569(-)
MQSQIEKFYKNRYGTDSIRTYMRAYINYTFSECHKKKEDFEGCLKKFSEEPEKCKRQRYEFYFCQDGAEGTSEAFNDHMLNYGTNDPSCKEISNAYKVCTEKNKDDPINCLGQKLDLLYCGVENYYKNEENKSLTEVMELKDGLYNLNEDIIISKLSD